ncbi:hypothetical protein A2311_02930 [candidate division WOR-1 bacterium RIFOXYB2_FULL_48_7]|uniref:Uncharacterized protein n=1 Tax=candidate division WOR-1 bacterium RIFOXYB2_FULL_48_7 TaxID=1802583 RepID=A0A1F4TW13_UNCSA|nr:MAG: hypothetical protein A2311_02930 [candidate division WOR-1 bacterium RIFOXYB2_FULL_48_7]
MKKLLVCLFASVLLFALSTASFAAAGKITFYDQNGDNTVFNSADVQTLGIKVKLPKPLSSYKYDYISVLIFPSYNPKLKWENGWKADDLEEDELLDFALMPESHLDAAHGKGIVQGTILDRPKTQAIPTMDLTAQVYIYKKTGQKQETKWDDVYKKWVTQNIDIWDNGKVIATGKATFNVPQMTAAEQQENEAAKAESLRQINEIRKKMGKPPLTELPKNTKGMLR